LKYLKAMLPFFFDETEIKGLEKWLDGRDQCRIAYENSSADFFYALEFESEICAFGGFYIDAQKPKAVLAWGMVDRKFQRRGLGSELLEFRLANIEKLFPGYTVVLDTSQHTHDFFRKFGFAVLKVTPEGYGPGLHRYDMVK
jgi:[ribosomal protein S18]-alanine N-acetyltransferase